ncbi:MAG: hypothetical protein OXG53_16450 [Chloroflexi bacterium]|nr:hypothetical protein [Chloroflexota bacterium]
MSLFVSFILAAVLLGAGAMLSPAWRSAQPRVALAATLCLGLVVGGAVFYAEAFSWDTLVVDYLLFALLSGVVLGGTLSTAQARAEARGERLDDRDQGWPGPGDLTFFAFAVLLLLIPLLHLQAPLGEAGQIIGFHSLATRDGGSFHSLAPLQLDEAVFVSPGFHALAAYLSAQLDQPIPLIQFSAAAVVALLIVWLAYDFGAELSDKRLGRALAASTLIGLGLYRSYLDGHFAELLALLFMAASMLYALRLLRKYNPADLVAAGLMMGAVAYTSLSLSLVTLLGWIALLVVTWSQKRHAITAESRLALTIGLPTVALLGIAPWLANNLARILPISPSPLPADLGNILLIIPVQGIGITILALWGMIVAFRGFAHLRFVSLLMLIWLLLVIEFSTIGVSGKLLPPLGALTNAPNLARHGPILPFAWFGGLALLDIWDRRLSRQFRARLSQATYPIIAIAAALLIGVAAAFNPLLHWLGFPPASLNQDDVAAMTWLRDNKPADAVVMAADGDAWLPLFAERRAPDFRAVRYFEWDVIRNVDLDWSEVDYVYVPGDAEPPANMPLKLVFEQGKARIYQFAKE